MENRNTDQIEERSVVKKPGTHHRGGFDRTRQGRSIKENNEEKGPRGRERERRVGLRQERPKGWDDCHRY